MRSRGRERRVQMESSGGGCIDRWGGISKTGVACFLLVCRNVFWAREGFHSECSIEECGDIGKRKLEKWADLYVGVPETLITEGRQLMEPGEREWVGGCRGGEWRDRRVQGVAENEWEIVKMR
ncbi:UNVERIFIED_CONTAM: hypothetical protein Sangu_2175500 [Sesamum angustifolium]|uniref:Uncharacterized protein n=1 Tax=Sesamum angustifolium TaxID=2727405 RepID=A0AAW2LE03_9LAMI